jgi:hypothetical protein
MAMQDTVQEFKVRRRVVEQALKRMGWRRLV